VWQYIKKVFQAELMTARIQLVRGIDEDVSDVRITRSKDGLFSVAKFIFHQPRCMSENSGNQNITGLYLIDEEGELISRTVNAKFMNGESTGIEAEYKMRGEEEFQRFLRFMERFAAENGMELNRK
jgi:photosystem II protein